MTKEMGRPPKLTPDVQTKLVGAIKMGSPIEVAAQYAGVSRRVFYDWMKRGNLELDRLRKNPKAKLTKREAPYVALIEAIDKGVADAEAFHVNVIANAGRQGDWKASAWLLERRFGEKWQKKEQTTVTHAGQVAINGDEVRKKLMEKLNMISANQKETAKTVPLRVSGDE